MPKQILPLPVLPPRLAPGLPPEGPLPGAASDGIFGAETPGVLTGPACSRVVAGGPDLSALVGNDGLADDRAFVTSFGRVKPPLAGPQQAEREEMLLAHAPSSAPSSAPPVLTRLVTEAGPDRDQYRQPLPVESPAGVGDRLAPGSHHLRGVRLPTSEAATGALALPLAVFERTLHQGAATGAFACPARLLSPNGTANQNTGSSDHWRLSRSTGTWTYDAADTAEGLFTFERHYYYYASLVYDGVQESGLVQLGSVVQPSGASDSERYARRFAFSVENVRGYGSRLGPMRRVTHVNVYRREKLTGQSSTLLSAPLLVHSEHLAASPGTSFVVEDDYNTGPAYEDNAGVSETLPTLDVRYRLSAAARGYHVVADVEVPRPGATTPHMPRTREAVLVSLPYMPDVLDWTKNWFACEWPVRALVAWRGFVVVAGEAESVIFDPEAVAVRERVMGLATPFANGVAAGESAVVAVSRVRVTVWDGAGEARDASRVLGPLWHAVREEGIRAAHVAHDAARGVFVVHVTTGGTDGQTPTEYAFDLWVEGPSLMWNQREEPRADAPKPGAPNPGVTLALGRTETGETVCVRASETPVEYVASLGAGGWWWQSQPVIFGEGRRQRLYHVVVERTSNTHAAPGEQESAPVWVQVSADGNPFVPCPRTGAERYEVPVSVRQAREHRVRFGSSGGVAVRHVALSARVLGPHSQV